ncbi:ribose 5-phosphate isomerase A [Pseudoclavibacter sp. RFBB5]|uniref:ribose 5-phosphate isomerase A n=1 Tax=Pseudoclavibacter sp. RFBB5 TaxID=2080574 RepID=UPI000CE79353|nr:ribose 5-phosphate isomerase A [Pseudoclavibacter sp. RFBB5]PPG32107.1 ribose 5-phosphate isomerase A [Pseudoclavibacter sp. RFBB5]
MTRRPIRTHDDQDRAKLAAGRYAAEKYCFEGAKLGLGSGTTSHYFVRALAEKVHDGLDVVGVPTSKGTRDLALELGITLVDLDDIDRLDVCIDGPDEVDPAGAMIKGGGACLLWEKLVERATAKFVVVADATKAVGTLGAFPLPIEVVQFSWGTTAKAIRSLLVEHGYPEQVGVRRRERDGAPVVTDNGNFIIDVQLDIARDIEELTVELNCIPGVVENGFFVGMAHEIVFGWPDGTAGAFSFPFAMPLQKPNAEGAGA